MAETRYLFGVPARGLLLGLGLAQLIGVVAGLGLGGITLAVGAPLPVAVVPVVAAGAWSWARLGDRRVHEWAAPALRQARRSFGGRGWRAPLAAVIVGPPALSGPERTPALPPELKGLRFGEVCLEGLRVGVAIEGRGAGRQATAVLGLQGPEGFSLAESEDQSAHIAAWARVLSALGTESKSLRRLCWVARAERIGSIDLPSAELGEGTARDAARADYARLVSEVAGRSARHQVFLGVQVVGAREGGASVAAGAESRRVADLLGAAGIGSRPLGRAELVRMIERWSDPATPGGAHAAEPGAMGEEVMRGRELAWSHLRSDGAFHRSWVVTAWPRVPVGPSWLEPLLACVPAGAARSFAVHLQPVPAATAARRAQAGRLNARLDQAQRTRWGFDVGARQAAELAEAERREEELVAGYPAHRVIAVVSVSAQDLGCLEEAGQAVEQAARAAGVDIRCCYGSQADAWAASLPLCRVREAKGR
ncbi:MAG: SCO6880 family protein [Acidimicrobiales bacterium]